ncbi:BrnT family toxin [Sphingomonas daechungensis]|uniref:BrnT family toxin n=1 Tax=Sphingomonas daechungensis TaxID=1176646 RepID=UPI003783C96A
MKLSYDPEKRARTLADPNRQLDFDDAVHVFAGATLTIEDDRRDYGEKRFQTVGLLNDRLVMIVWTKRDEALHIISMRKCNGREQERFEARVDRFR